MGGIGWPVARPRLLSAVPGEACCTDCCIDGSCDVLGSSAGCEEAGRDSRKIGLCLFYSITLETSGREGSRNVAFRLGSLLSDAPDHSGLEGAERQNRWQPSPLYLCSFAPTKRVLSLLRISRTSRRITSPRASRNLCRWIAASGCVGGSSSKKRTHPLSAVFKYIDG